METPVATPAETSVETPVATPMKTPVVAREQASIPTDLQRESQATQAREGKIKQETLQPSAPSGLLPPGGMITPVHSATGPGKATTEPGIFNWVPRLKAGHEELDDITHARRSVREELKDVGKGKMYRWPHTKEIMWREATKSFETHVDDKVITAHDDFADASIDEVVTDNEDKLHWATKELSKVVGSDVASSQLGFHIAQSVAAALPKNMTNDLLDSTDPQCVGLQKIELEDWKSYDAACYDDLNEKEHVLRSFNQQIRQQEEMFSVSTTTATRSLLWTPKNCYSPSMHEVQHCRGEDRDPGEVLPGHGTRGVATRCLFVVLVHLLRLVQRILHHLLATIVLGCFLGALEEIVATLAYRLNVAACVRGALGGRLAALGDGSGVLRGITFCRGNGEESKNSEDAKRHHFWSGR